LKLLKKIKYLFLKDVKELVEKLKSSNVSLLQVPLKSFNHLDFMWANEAKKYVYDLVLSAMKKGSEQAKHRLNKERLTQDWDTITLRAAQGREIVVRNYEKHAKPSLNYMGQQLKQVNIRINK